MSGFTAFGTRRRPAPIRRVNGWEGCGAGPGLGGRGVQRGRGSVRGRGAEPGLGWEGVEPNRGHAPRTVRGNDLLLKPIRQSISGCRSTREDVHLRPQSRWFEGEFDGKIQRSKVQDEVDGGAGGRAAAAAGGGAGGRAAAAGCGGGLRVGAGGAARGGRRDGHGGAGPPGRERGAHRRERAGGRGYAGGWRRRGGTRG